MLYPIIRYMRRFLASEKGQGLVEYGLLGLLIAVACVAAVTLLGTEIINLYERIITSWPFTAP